MAVGGLGVTLAGFAGLIAALQGPEGPVAAWRIRNVVYLGSTVTLTGFGTVALYTLTQDVALTVRVASIVMLAAVAARWGEHRPGAAWPDEGQRRGFIFTQLLFAIAVAVNIVLANVGYLQILLLLMLSAPLGIFARSVRDVTGGSGAESRARESAASEKSSSRGD